MSEKHIGKVLQVIGPVLDIQFEDGQLPELLNAIEIDMRRRALLYENDLQAHIPVYFGF